MRFFTISALIIFAISCSVLAKENSKLEVYKCEYLDLSKDIALITEKCQIEETKKNGNFTYILRWTSGFEVVIEQVNSDSGYSIWKINNEPGVGMLINDDDNEYLYENIEHIKGFTLDLKQFFKIKFKSL